MYYSISQKRDIIETTDVIDIYDALIYEGMSSDQIKAHQMVGAARKAVVELMIQLEVGKEKFMGLAAEYRETYSKDTN